MFDSENQHNMIKEDTPITPVDSKGINPSSFKSSVDSVGPNPDPVPTGFLYGTTPKVYNNLRYVDGSFTIFLDDELVNQLIVYTEGSKSKMEKYTEAVARISDYFEGIRDARCSFHSLKNGISCVSVNFPNKYAKDVYAPDKNARPKLSYNGEQFILDLQLLKKHVRSLKENKGGINYAAAGNSFGTDVCL